MGYLRAFIGIIWLSLVVATAPLLASEGMAAHLSFMSEPDHTRAAVCFFIFGFEIFSTAVLVPFFFF